LPGGNNTEISRVFAIQKSLDVAKQNEVVGALFHPEEVDHPIKEPEHTQKAHLGRVYTFGLMQSREN
jgi:glutamine amidotransferase PdxT